MICSRSLVHAILAFTTLANSGLTQAQSCPPTLGVEGPGGGETPGDVNEPDLSMDGRYVAFESWSSGLVPGDTNGWRDIFRYDRQTGSLIRVSLDVFGGQASQASAEGHISGDGSRIAFWSSAGLDPADTGESDVYMRDVDAGTTVWVSRRPYHGGGPDEGSSWPRISGNGRYVAFHSDATNLVPGDTNGWTDVFLYDTETGALTRESVGPGGVEGNRESTSPDISWDGRYLAFTSRASNLVANDTNGKKDDVFVRDLKTGMNEIVTLTPSGLQVQQGSGILPAISGCGRFACFRSNTDIIPGFSNGLNQLYLRDRFLGTTTPITTAWTGGPASGGHPAFAEFSRDGRYLAFTSQQDNLVPGDTNGHSDAFLFDALDGSIRLMSPGLGGQGANQKSFRTSISGGGTVVAYDTLATNLIPGITGLQYDIVTADCGTPPPAAFCDALVNSLGCTPTLSWSGTASVSAGAGFDLVVDQLINQKFGTLVYGTRNWTSTPFAGGTLCVQGPLRRLPISSTGGTPGGGGADCSGRLSADLNAWIASGADPSLVAGEAVYAQFLSRDPGALGTLSLSEAVAFTLIP